VVSGNATFNGQVLAKNNSNSTTAFQVQNAAGDAIFNVSTTDANNNLLANPSGEQAVGASNWQAKNGATISQDSTKSWIGSNSIKMVTTATAGDGIKQNVTLSNSTQYTFGGELTGSGLSTIVPGYFDGTTENDCTLSPASSSIGPSVWRIFQCTFTTPASHSGTPYIYFRQTDAASHTMNMDAMLLVQASGLPTFQQGTISLNGVIQSPVIIRAQGDSNGLTGSFVVQNAAGGQLAWIDNSGTLGIAQNLNVTNGFGVRSNATAASLHYESDGSIYVDTSTATVGANKNVVLKTGGSTLIQNSSSTLVNISNSGATTFKNSTDSANAFQVQNSTGASLLNVDTVNSAITLLGNNSGEVSTWSTAINSVPASLYVHSSVVANGYVYVIGGSNGSTSQSAIYYAKLNSDGSVGSWTTASNALPTAREQHTSVYANGYLYVIGGINGTAQSTVYYAKLNADGSVGTWQTAANALPEDRENKSSVVSNGYVYVIGG
jgi:hypothetical protein